MCVDPITAAAVGSGVLSAVGAIRQGSAQKSALDAEAAALDAQAANRLRKAEFDKEQSRRDYTKHAGRSVARAVGYGLDIGSFSDILDDDAKEAALERAAIEYTAKIEADNLRIGAQSRRIAGKDAKTASYISAAGGLLASFASARRLNNGTAVALNP